MGLHSRLKAGNHVISDVEADKYAASAVRIVVSFDPRTGHHDGYCCTKKHTWHSQMQAWVGAYCVHHVSRYLEVTGPYDEWKARTGK